MTHPDGRHKRTEGDTSVDENAGIGDPFDDLVAGAGLLIGGTVVGRKIWRWVQTQQGPRDVLQDGIGRLRVTVDAASDAWRGSRRHDHMAAAGSRSTTAPEDIGADPDMRP